MKFLLFLMLSVLALVVCALPNAALAAPAHGDHVIQIAGFTVEATAHTATPCCKRTCLRPCGKPACSRTVTRTITRTKTRACGCDRTVTVNAERTGLFCFKRERTVDKDCACREARTGCKKDRCKKTNCRKKARCDETAAQGVAVRSRLALTSNGPALDDMARRGRSRGNSRGGSRGSCGCA